MTTATVQPALTAASPPRSRLKAPTPTLSVIIPAYNEEGAVRATVGAVSEALRDAGVEYQIVVVDDGSKDNTLSEAQASGAEVIEKPQNMGYGHSLKAGIAATDSDFVAILDADGTYPADLLPKMIQIAGHTDMVVGDRGAAMKNVPLLRRPAKWFLTKLASALARQKVNDLNSGMRIFRRSALEPFIPLLPDGFSFTTTITLCMLASNLRVVYVPIEYAQRVGHSKIRASHFFKFLLLVIRLTVLFQPLRVFLPLGALLFVAGAMKAVYDVMLLDLSESAIFGLLGAFMVWSFGLLADMVARLHLRPQTAETHRPLR